MKNTFLQEFLKRIEGLRGNVYLYYENDGVFWSRHMTADGVFVRVDQITKVLENMLCSAYTSGSQSLNPSSNVPDVVNDDIPTHTSNQGTSLFHEWTETGM